MASGAIKPRNPPSGGRARGRRLRVLLCAARQPTADPPPLNCSLTLLARATLPITQSGSSTFAVAAARHDSATAAAPAGAAAALLCGRVSTAGPRPRRGRRASRSAAACAFAVAVAAELQRPLGARASQRAAALSALAGWMAPDLSSAPDVFAQPELLSHRTQRMQVRALVGRARSSCARACSSAPLTRGATRTLTATAGAGCRGAHLSVSELPVTWCVSQSCMLTPCQQPSMRSRARSLMRPHQCCTHASRPDRGVRAHHQPGVAQAAPLWRRVQRGGGRDGDQRHPHLLWRLPGARAGRRRDW